MSWLPVPSLSGCMACQPSWRMRTSIVVPPLLWVARLNNEALGEAMPRIPGSPFGESQMALTRVLTVHWCYALSFPWMPVGSLVQSTPRWDRCRLTEASATIPAASSQPSLRGRPLPRFGQLGALLGRLGQVQQSSVVATCQTSCSETRLQSES